MDQAHIVEFLRIEREATLLECARVCRASTDSCDAVLKLISAGVLELAEREPLSAASNVRLRNNR